MKLNKNKKFGFLIIGIGLLIGYIIYSFNKALKDIVSISQCVMEQCPHEAALAFQTNLSLIILVLVIVVGVVFLFLKENKQEIKKENLENLKTLNKDERKIYEIIKKEESIFQSDLVEKSEFTKVKVTRILDRLEGKKLIERKRRGMTNIVIIK